MRSFLLLMIAGLLGSCTAHHGENKVITIPSKPIPQQPIAPDTSRKPGAWLKELDKLDTTDTCIAKAIRLVRYLETEKLSKRYTFEHYRTPYQPPAMPAPLNINSLRSARAFRTNIGRELKAQGVNFAGRYSLVGVGMTGWGQNRWIVDRTNGRAYDFPYKTEDITFQKNSNLIIVRSKGMYWGYLEEVSDPRELCNINSIYDPEIDLRPAYFLWQNNRLILLGPKGIRLPRTDEYWEGYFGRR